MEVTWHCLPLLARLDVEGERAWQAAWTTAYEQAPCPAGAALFLQLTIRSGDSLYFSPQAHDLADMFGAKPCDKPSPVNLRLVAGHAKSWQTHYPGAEPTTRDVVGRSFCDSGVATSFDPTAPAALPNAASPGPAPN